MKKILLFITALFFFSCAQIQNPTGGAKDITPPKIIKAKPSNQSTNFSKDQKIEITFDEFVKLNNLSKELIVSPPLNPIPTIKTKGKKLSIDLSECTLQENTTYSIFLGDALVDYNEGNAIRNLSYVFSTGNTIDSLYITGNVIDMETGFVGINTSVLLYTNLEDTFLKSAPSYMAKTDSFGRFKIENLPKKEFQLFVIQDDNNNKKPDNEESIAFINKTVIPDTNTIIPVMYLSKPITYTKHSIKDTVQNNFSTKLIFSKEINTNQIEVKTDKNTAYKKYKINMDTLILYQNEKLTRINVFNRDTIVFQSYRKIDSLVSSKNPYNILNINFLTEKDTLLLQYQNPINKLYKTDFQIIIDSNIQTGKILKKDPFTLAYIFPMKESQQYSIVYDYSTINPKDTTANDTFNILVRPNNTLGTIICKINTDSSSYGGNYILQLINNKLVVKEEIIKSDEVNFAYLREGIYTLKVIIDANKDNKWNPGNKDTGSQPEQIIHYKNEIEVKQNWDIEVNIGLK